MEVKSRVKTSWGEVSVIHVRRTPLEALETMGRSKRCRERLEKKLNVKNDRRASERLRALIDKLLNSLEENYGKVNN